MNNTGLSKQAFFSGLLIALFLNSLSFGRTAIDTLWDNSDSDASWKPIHRAAKKGDADAVSRLLLDGEYVDVRTDGGITPLEAATRYGSMSVSQVLIAHGADLNATDTKGFTPIHWAVESDSKDIVEYLISKGADISPPHGQRLMVSAAAAGYTDIVEMLLSKGIDPGRESEYGLSSLCAASRGSYEDIVKILLSSGADVAYKDKDGSNLLSCVWVRRGRGCIFRAEESYYISAKNVIDMLIQNGVSPDEKDNAGRNALFWHVYDEKIFEMILPLVQDIDAIDNNGKTPLANAVLIGKPECVGSLLARGADANIATNDGKTPLYFAIMRDGNIEKAKLLIEHGARVNEKYYSGLTLLHYAVELQIMPYMRILVENGADINAKDDNGETPLHKAVTNGKSHVIEYLVQNGADINAKDRAGFTPLSIAERRGDIFTVNLMKRAANERSAEEDK